MDIEIYKILKTLHIIFFTTWMAGLFYLPRLFVYHCQVKIRTNEYKRFVTMERKLLKYIMNPSFIITWGIGIILVMNIEPALWINIKIICIVLMSAFHMYCAKIRVQFEKNNNKKNEKFFRYINEVPTILFIVIVFLAVFKPGI
jgi:putative membrane protein